MRPNTAGSDPWVQAARSVPIEAEIARRGIKLKRTGHELIGPCPHCGGDDRFGVNIAKQIFNCRGCGVGGDVIDLVQHIDGVDFNVACAALAGEQPKITMNGETFMSSELKKVGTEKYVYKDENGAVLFAVLRYEFQNSDGSFVIQNGKRRKTFRQKRPDPDRPGEWLKNVDGVPVVPYRLPELIEAIGSGHLVVIAEGEAKVDLLRSWNVPATCNAGGAGKWKPEHSAFLRGADVVILPDNDLAGRKHCDVVGASLQGVAASVRVLDELPGLGSKQDIIDWAAAGGTVEQLHHLIEHEAKPWTPRNEADSVPHDTATGAEQQEQPGNGHAETADLGEWDAGDEAGLPPPRQWLLGNQFCRGFLSGLPAPGATGKTATRMLQYLSLATGRALSGQHVFKRSRVLVVGLEDDRDEMRRRIAAACVHHRIDRAELKGWLFCANPKGLKLAESKNGTFCVGRLMGVLRAAIERRKPGLLALDPFVKLHNLAENDNTSMDFVADLLVQLADEYNIAVDAPHHTRKGLIAAGDADAGRGASAARDAGRLVYTLTRMTEDEAKAFSISPEDRDLYVRLDSGKVNIARPARTATWFKLIGVRLDNGNEDYPNGDEVQTVEPWSPPKTWEGLSSITLNTALTDIDNGLPNGQRYTTASKATDRAAWKVVQKHCPDRTEPQCREIINTWVDNGVLYNEDYDDPVERKPRKGLKLDPTKRPSS